MVSPRATLCVENHERWGGGTKNERLHADFPQAGDVEPKNAVQPQRRVSVFGLLSDFRIVLGFRVGWGSGLFRVSGCLVQVVWGFGFRVVWG